MAQTFIIFRHRDLWYVGRRGRCDLDLTRALQTAMRKLSDSTAARVSPFICDYFNYRIRPGEPDDAFITEGVITGRERMTAFLEDRGFDVVYSDREDDAYYVEHGTGFSYGILACQLTACARIYAKLARMRLRPTPNPLKIDDWDLLSDADRFDLRDRLFGHAEITLRYSGAQFVVNRVPHSPIRMEDPRGLPARMLRAAEADQWKASPFALLATMADTGARHCTVRCLTARDWLEASDFGRVILGPNKGSHGKRTLDLVITERTIGLIWSSIAANPLVTSTDDVRAMAKRGELKALGRIYLFANPDGGPYSYHTFNNDYVRPTMTRHPPSFHHPLCACRIFAISWSRTGKGYGNRQRSRIAAPRIPPPRWTWRAC